MELPPSHVIHVTNSICGASSRVRWSFVRIFLRIGSIPCARQQRPAGRSQALVVGAQRWAMGGPHGHVKILLSIVRVRKWNSETVLERDLGGGLAFGFAEPGRGMARHSAFKGNMSI